MVTEEETRLKKRVLELTEELRVANQRHKAAASWAMNENACLHSHLRVCKSPETQTAMRASTLAQRG